MIYITTFILFALVIYIWVFSPLETSDRVGITTAISMVALFVVTSIYAWHTRKMATEMKEQARATKEQAEASIEMAEEMREQRIIESRPVIIQKAETIEVIPSEHSTDYFEIYNAGNGPAIEVEISLVLQRKPPYQPHNCKREGFLRAGDTPIEFYTTFPPDVANSTFYIVSEYQGISSYSTQPTWYQTWMPCKLSISGKVICGKLEFDEVSEENRIGIFNSEFNNGS